jgi:predicted permease
MKSFWSDLRFAFRQFHRARGVIAIAVVLMAAGIGAATLIFSLVDALLLTRLPVKNPEELVQLREIRGTLPPLTYFSYPFYRTLAAHSATLFDVAGQFEWDHPLEAGGPAERVRVGRVTDNLYSVLGVEPWIGHLPAPGDDGAAVLSYGLWERSFGRDPSVIGRTIHVQGQPFTVAAVMPQSFHGINVETSVDLRLPFRSLRQIEGGEKPWLENSHLEILARLRPGVSLSQAQQETAALWRADAETADTAKELNFEGRLELLPIERGVSPLRNQFGAALTLLLGGTGLILLMVCANVGGLLLARAMAREKETAIRLAIGASRGRLIRQWLTESLLLGALGGLGGIAAAWMALPALMRLIPPLRDRGGELLALQLNAGLTLRVALFCLLACLVSAVIAGLAPAWRVARNDLQTVLRTGSGDFRHGRFQALLAAIQVALCTLLLFHAGLTLSTLHHLRSLDPGFDGEHVVMFSVDPSMAHYNAGQTWTLQQRLTERVRALPGVQAAAAAGRGLMRGIGLKTSVILPGQKLTKSQFMNSSLNEASAGYFEAMGMRIDAGRDFRDSDSGSAEPRPAIVNEAFVKRFFNGREPLQQVFATGTSYVKPGFRIVGVVSDAHYRSLRETPPPTFYSCLCGPDSEASSFILHVRAHGDPRALIRPVTEALASLDPSMPFVEVQTLSQEVDRSLWQERMVALLASWFAGFAALLAGLGIYATLAHFVAARRREIGVRMALGAGPVNVIRLVFGPLGIIAGCGVLTGLAAAITSAAWVYGAATWDIGAVLAAILLLCIVGIAAGAPPAWRALHVDPAVALREE